MDNLAFTLSIILRHSLPVILAVLGEVVSETAGIVNLGLEGMMLAGALLGVSVAVSTGSSELGLLAGCLGGVILALLLALLVNGLKLNQFVAGIAVYVLGYAVTALLGRVYTGLPLPTPHFIGPFEVATLALLVLPLVAHAASKSRFWRMLKSVGDNPLAADMMGIDVALVRSTALIISGLLSGLAGAYIALVVYERWQQGVTAGLGWLALALTPMTAWRPILAYIPGLVYAASWLWRDVLTLHAPGEIASAAPYIYSLAAAAIAARFTRTRAPRALGREYVHGMR